MSEWEKKKKSEKIVNGKTPQPTWKNQNLKGGGRRRVGFPPPPPS